MIDVYNVKVHFWLVSNTVHSYGPQTKHYKGSTHCITYGFHICRKWVLSRFVDNYLQSSQGSTGSGASNHDSYISMEAIDLNLDVNHQPQVENGHNDLRLVMTILPTQPGWGGTVPDVQIQRPQQQHEPYQHNQYQPCVSHKGGLSLQYHRG